MKEKNTRKSSMLSMQGDKGSKWVKEYRGEVMNYKKDEYYLSSIFPNDDVMNRVYSIIRKSDEA